VPGRNGLPERFPKRRAQALTDLFVNFWANVRRFSTQCTHTAIMFEIKRSSPLLTKCGKGTLEPGDRRLTTQTTDDRGCVPGAAQHGAP